VAEHADPLQIEGRVRERGEMVDRGGDIFEGGGPAAAVADSPVLDVPDCPSPTHEIAGEPAREDLAVARLPGAAMD
jgi:hypothetical protein